MTHTYDPLEKNAYLISTSFKSFGYIIGSTDTIAPSQRKRTDNFFECFRFSPDVTKRIFEILTTHPSCSVFAADIHSNGFLFYHSSSTSGIFAFVKRFDINPDEAATIIREGFANEIICLYDKTSLDLNDCCEETYKAIKAILSLSSMEDILKQKIQSASISAVKANGRFRLDTSDIEPTTVSASDKYILCVGGFTLFLCFLYMSVSKPDVAENVKISLKARDGCHVISADIRPVADSSGALFKKLDFLKDIMDAHNLNLFYSDNGGEIKAVFLPYYIDDGLCGVKAPLELLYT